MSRKKYQHKAPNAKSQQFGGIQWVMPSDRAKIVTLPKGHHPALDLQSLESLKKAQPRQAQQRVPDGTIPIIAWRAWGLTTNDKGWLLAGLGVNEEWVPRKVMTAKCISDRFGLMLSLWGTDKPRKHLSPGSECNCGVWAFRTLEELLSALKEYKDVRVIGMVYLWGRILECEKGYRAQHAYPAELWLLDDSLEELGWIYGVPVRTAK